MTKERFNPLLLVGSIENPKRGPTAALWVLILRMRAEQHA